MLILFTVGETVLYLIYKIVRRDFWWWPQIEGNLKPVLAICTRVIVKVIVDFTGCFHFRHPFELGGLVFR